MKCPSEVMAGIIEHVNSSTDAEVGGILVGHFGDDGPAVVASVPAHKATSETANVTFTHEVWEEVLPAIDRDHPGEVVVGWYHSHPGFGVFLSEYDKFIQTNFFGNPQMEALVIDPLLGEGGWFEWNEGEIVDGEQFETPKVVSQRAAAAKEAKVGSQRRGSFVVVAAGMVLVGLVAGYFLGQNQGRTISAAPTGSGSSSEVRSLQQQVSDLETQLGTKIDPLSLQRCTYSYTVRSGDSLWAIAQRRFGDGSKYPQLETLNPEIGTNGLNVGAQIQIPARNCAPASGAGADQ